MSIEFTYKIPTEGLFKPFKGILDRNLSDAMKKIQKRLTMEVRTIHRYKQKTKNLRKATRTKRKRGRVHSVFVWVDEGKASYAKFVIGGQRSWKPDRYVNRALQKNRGWILATIQEALDKSVDEFNRG